ncbi:MAG: hypothetical protein LBB20_03425 [Puniceicoccales bacterium]|jgi:hypothetical protein|nr:hypothetical protein [Puniceicoccales bacterium]
MTAKTKGDLLLDMMFNIVIPSIVMSKADDWLDITPLLALLIALGFPIVYGIVDFAKSKKYNTFSIMGFVSIFLTGGIGLLQLPKEWIAIKEAAVPLILGLFVTASIWTNSPLMRILLFQDNILNTSKIEEALEKNSNRPAFDKLIRRGTLWVSSSFWISAILNYILAVILIKSDTGTSAFNKELGRMTLWSYPVIVLPCTVILMISLCKLISGIEKLTGLQLEEIVAFPSSNRPHR